MYTQILQKAVPNPYTERDKTKIILQFRKVVVTIVILFDPLP